MSELPNKSLPLGTVVALKNHPFAYQVNSQYLLIRGDGDSIPPLLVIGEAMRTVKSNFDEQTGVELAKKNDFTYKCYWYSLKSREFKDIWVQGKHIEVVKEATAISNIEKRLEEIRSSINNGALVNFNSTTYELEKIKCSNRYNKDFTPQSPTLGNMVSYIAPTMELIGLVMPEDKDPKFDVKDGHPKRHKTIAFGKCRYFNPEQNKFSEILLPIETLTLEEKTYEANLKIVKQAIEDKCHIEINSGEIFDILLPKKLAYAGGNWSVWGESIYSFKIISYNLSTVNVGLKNLQNIGYLPSIEDEDEGESIKMNKINPDSLSIKLRALSKLIYLMITYKNHLGKYSKRTLSDCKIIKVEKDTSVNTDTYWLHGHCHLKNAKRSFLIDRIKEIEFLEMKSI